MNKREIDELMRDLPSQKPVETLGAKIGIILLFIGIFYVMAMLPNIVRAQNDQKESYCRESSRRAATQNAARSIGMD
jgi:hypothetical protein